jgi:hypothetical protein
MGFIGTKQLYIVPIPNHARPCLLHSEPYPLLSFLILIFVIMASGSMRHHIDIEAQEVVSQPPGASGASLVNSP